MTEEARALEVVFRAVSDFNENLPEKDRLHLSPDTILFGKSGKLDSLGLVNLVLLIEEEIYSEYGLSITIADERAISQRKNPFKTIQRLTEYVSLLVEEQRHG